MRVLVTGGAGFVGRRVAQRLAARGDTAIAFDTVIAPGAGADDGAILSLTGDLADPINLIEVFRRTEPDAVVHCAAIVGVLSSLGSPNNVVRINLQGSLNLFDAMRLHEVRRVVHLSSIEVYGDFKSAAVTEEHPLNPLMPYGICKLAVEQFGRTYGERHGLECVNLRGTWIYGADLPRVRLPNLLFDAVLKGTPIHLPEGGDSVMDYLHVDDAVTGILAALDLENHPFDIYNLGFGQGTPLSDLFGLVGERFPSADISVGPGAYRFSADLPMRQQGTVDLTRAKAALGFTPACDIRDGLERHVQALG